MREVYQILQDEISAFLAGPAGKFEDLAHRLFRFQYERNRPYRAYCEALAVTPGTVGSWVQIPAVPTEAFKAREPLSCHPPEECGRIFLTSGTTQEVRGRHYFADTALYESSIRHGWVHADLPTALRPLCLSRPPASLPDSSLAFMFGVLAAGPAPAAWLLTESGSIEPGPLREAASSGDPLILFSTALALRHLFERYPGEIALPPGSWVFQTGGYKGLATTYEPAALYDAITQHLGVPPARVINEYGMTELSSASYALGLSNPHQAPPWLKVRTIHPETNLPNPPGEPGHLAFFDLANFNSVAALRTRDLGTALDDHRFVLEGRDPAASPRGCSRASDAHLQTP